MGCNCGGAKYIPPQQLSGFPTPVVSPLPGQSTPTVQQPTQIQQTPTVVPQLASNSRGGYVIPPNGGPGGTPNAS